MGPFHGLGMVASPVSSNNEVMANLSVILKEVEKVDNFAQAKKLMDAGSPVVLTERLVVSTELQDAFGQFKTRFASDGLFNTAKRGAEQIVDEQYQELTAFRNAVCSAMAPFTKHLSISEQEYVATPWFWGYAPTGMFKGPEFACMSSIKLQLCGSRDVVLADCDQLVEYAKSVKSAGSTVSMHDVVSELAEADANRLESMRKAGVVVFKAHIEEGQTFLLPWSYILVEAIRNNEMCAGVRWMDVNSTVNAGVKTLVKMMVPQVVPAGSSTALLQKVFQAADAANGGSSSQLLAVKRQQASGNAPVKKAKT